jgi:very-short-patch-repair endonuclease
VQVNRTLRNRARELRRAQTDAENKLWIRLRARQVGGEKFRRQHPIGPLVVDFCCVERGLVVELDGGQHAVDAKKDQRGSAFLGRRGYRELRFWNDEVLKNTEGVLAEIARMLTDPHPSLSLKGRG